MRGSARNRGSRLIIIIIIIIIKIIIVRYIDPRSDRVINRRPEYFGPAFVINRLRLNDSLDEN